MRDRFAGEFETVTETAWPPQGIHSAITFVLSAADADKVIDKVTRGVEDGAGPAHNKTRHGGRHPPENVARDSAPDERDGRGAPDAFASPPRTPLTGRRRPRDESSKDGPASRTVLWRIVRLPPDVVDESHSRACVAGPRVLVRPVRRDSSRWTRTE